MHLEKFTQALKQPFTRREFFEESSHALLDPVYRRINASLERQNNVEALKAVETAINDYVDFSGTTRLLDDIQRYTIFVPQARSLDEALKEVDKVIRDRKLDAERNAIQTMARLENAYGASPNIADIVQLPICVINGFRIAQDMSKGLGLFDHHLTIASQATPARCTPATLAQTIYSTTIHELYHTEAVAGLLKGNQSHNDFNAIAINDPNLTQAIIKASQQATNPKDKLNYQDTLYSFGSHMFALRRRFLQKPEYVPIFKWSEAIAEYYTARFGEKSRIGHVPGYNTPYGGNISPRDTVELDTHLKRIGIDLKTLTRYENSSTTIQSIIRATMNALAQVRKKQPDQNMLEEIVTAFYMSEPNRIDLPLFNINKLFDSTYIYNGYNPPRVCTP